MAVIKAFNSLKISKIHIFCSRILLAFFILGQVMVYAHQHKTGSINRHSSSNGKETVKEKCAFCDVMQHNNMAIESSAVVYSNYYVAHVFQPLVYNFKSLSLILSCGRAPPGSVISIA